jgi:hypothetical protein
MVLNDHKWYITYLKERYIFRKLQPVPEEPLNQNADLLADAFCHYVAVYVSSLVICQRQHVDESNPVTNFLFGFIRIRSKERWQCVHFIEILKTWPNPTAIVHYMLAMLRIAVHVHDQTRKRRVIDLSCSLSSACELMHKAHSSAPTNDLYRNMLQSLLEYFGYHLTAQLLKKHNGPSCEEDKTNWRVQYALNKYSVFHPAYAF